MYFCTLGDKKSKPCNDKCCERAWFRCQLLICMTSCYTVYHLFGKIHQNKAPAPLLTSRDEGNVLSVPPLETHGMVLWVICHCWQVFCAALSGPIEHHVLWHTSGRATHKLFLVSCSVSEHFKHRFRKFSQCNGPRKWCQVRWECVCGTVVGWSFMLLLSLLEWRIHLNLTADSLLTNNGRGKILVSHFEIQKTFRKQ